MSAITSIIKFFAGSKSDRDRKTIEPYVARTLEIYPTLAALSNDELRARSAAMKVAIAEFIAPEEARVAELKAGIDSSEIALDQKEAMAKEIENLTKRIDEKIEEKLDELLPEAFAVMKDTARRFKDNSTIEVTANEFDRNLAAKKDFVAIEGDKAVYKNSWSAGGNMVTWDMVHYDVQLFGGVALHKGNIAEMATGEGKTLVATLPVFLNALAGKGVHMVTVNNYLAQRDSEWMGPMYEFHGLSVDCIDRHTPNSAARRKAYLADITFGTNNEYGFDYLRDNMSIQPDDLVQRKHHFAIVDEVDSVLVDDARTPLIISGPVPKGDDQMFEEYRSPIDGLYNLQKADVTRMVSESRRLFGEGKADEAGILLLRAHKGLPKYKPLIKFLSETGVKALLQKTENTYMADNNKRMPEITDDLWFVIEEKQNSVELTDKGHENLSRTFKEDGFFVLPDIGSEVAALEAAELTAEEKAEKKDALVADYSVKTERVHTVNQLLKAYSMFEKDIEYVVMDNKVKIVDEQTGRILEGRRYSDGLHQAIEAKERVTVEAATQTFATITLQNYFRMYHKLGGMTGTAETEAAEFWDIYKLDVIVIPTNRPIIRDDRQDLIYKTKREKYNAVIDEIVRLVEAGRPVLVGTTSVEISELLSRMLKLRGIKHNVLNAKQHQQEAQIVAEAGHAGQVTIATNMAGRGTDIKLTAEVKAAGGLAIIGTERHDSRRVDRQLRGRAGRQGDPGSSQFFVSLEDDLMRLFGSGRIAAVMDRMGLEEGEVIQAKMMTNAIERAQKKVEENNYGIRKRLLQYDDVMNSQRTVIYTRRRHALFGERVELDLDNIMWDFAEEFAENWEGADFDEATFELIRLAAVHPSFDEAAYKKADKKELAGMIVADLRTTYQRRAEAVTQVARPIINKVFEEQGAQYENIRIPITNGHLGYNVSVNLARTHENGCADIYKTFAKLVMLTTIDDNWREHLREMDDLRQSVQNATYEQKDPLLIYKFESFGLFSKMLAKINREVLSIVGKSYIPVRPAGAAGSSGSPQQAAAALQQQRERAQVDVNRLHASRMEAARAAGAGDRGKPMPVQVEKKVGRNDPCPCGSGKKYKQCHGKDAV
ncbi:MAG: preprotein translocase subunit SecA [Alistipes sp.]|jgi:preprotein translocase subunit SecA|nr:preprotein translocase subunit SecA [Alistipes sp.]